jgi:hypothetical protein
LKFRIATAPIIAGRLRCDGRQQILERLIKRSPVLDRHGMPTVLYLRPLRGFDGLKPFLLQVKQRRIRAAIVQVITGVIGQSAKAVAPRVVLS